MSEAVQLARMQRVYSVLSDGRSFVGVTGSMVEAINELSSLETGPDRLDHRLVSIHAAATILSCCMDVGKPASIQAYRRLTLARRQLASLAPRSQARGPFELVVIQNQVQGNRYFDLAKGVDAWRNNFMHDYTRLVVVEDAVDPDEATLRKLDLYKYTGLVERTQSRLPVAVRVAANVEQAYSYDEPVSSAFGDAGQLFRYVVDQTYPEIVPHRAD